jgi:hypothetical protein
MLKWKWLFNINEKALIKKNRNMEYSINNDFSIAGKVRNSFQNNAFYYYQKDNYNLSKNTIIEKLEKENEITIQDFEKQITDNIVTESYNFTSNNLIEVIGNKLYIQPLLFLFEYPNPFTATERQQNIDFIYKKNHKIMVNINLPEGYEIDYLPKTVNFALPEGIANFKYIVQKNNQKLNIIFTFIQDKTIVYRDLYEEVKTFYQNIFDSLTDKIVLKKL